MSGSIGIWSVLPPLLAIFVALWKRQIIPALMAGGMAGEFLTGAMNGGDSKWLFVVKYLDRAVTVTAKPDNLELIVFSLSMGGLIELIRQGGGFAGLTHWLSGRRNGTTKGMAYTLTWVLGSALFLENWSNILINGATMGGVYKKLGIPKERLAYFIHSISINMVALILINSWGAFYMSLLSAQDVARPFQLLVKSVPFNFHCLLSLVMVGCTMVFDWRIGPMKKAFIPVAENPSLRVEPEVSEYKPVLLNMLLPITVLTTVMLVTLYYTGGGRLTDGDGTKAVFYAVCAALTVLMVKLVAGGVFSLARCMEIVFAGMGKFMQVGILVVLALTMGQLCRQMGTGFYIAALARQHLPLGIIPALIFLISCLISFSTGTSYGTFSIMVPIAMQLSAATGIYAPLIFAACISGGVFGDNTSPLSGTSIVTGMATELDVVQHVRTQLPYASIAAGLAFILFIIAGFLTI